MDIDFSKRDVFETEDGSCSLRLREANEQYHSVHGAINESKHIYIQNGLMNCHLPIVHVLELGFGTGLNAILTFLCHRQQSVCYDAVEAYPLTMCEVEKLNYPALWNDFPKEIFTMMHTVQSGNRINLNNHFIFRKWIGKIEDVALPSQYYNLVYFDMFNPDLQPELWTEEIFAKIYLAMKENASLLTYCAKGSVKRALKKVGFQVESLPGPVGKREITRATK